MCEYGNDVEIAITKRIRVDACIADVVLKLNSLGIYTLGSCCGHGKGPTSVVIESSTVELARNLEDVCAWEVDVTDLKL